MDDEIEPRWYTYGIAEHKRHPWRHYRWFAKRRADERSREIECRVEQRSAS